MRRRGVWQRGLAGCALALGCVTGAGCLSFVHPIHSPPQDCIESCLAVPKCCKDHVYIFLINGLDPLGFGNLGGVRDYLHSLGFAKTYYAQMYHAASIKREVRRVHEEDPEARFVLMGFSFGANLARSITRDVQEDDIYIDLLVYVSANTMQNVPRDRPENAGLIVNILASEIVRNGAWIDNAANAELPDGRHFSAPTHPYTLRALAQELTLVAVRVPIPQQVNEEALPPVAGPEPTPRPVPPARMGRRDDWDFLKPVSHLSLPQTPGRRTEPAAPQETVAVK